MKLAAAKKPDLKHGRRTLLELNTDTLDEPYINTAGIFTKEVEFRAHQRQASVLALAFHSLKPTLMPRSCAKTSRLEHDFCSSFF